MKKILNVIDFGKTKVLDVKDALETRDAVIDVAPNHSYVTLRSEKFKLPGNPVISIMAKKNAEEGIIDYIDMLYKKDLSTFKAYQKIVERDYGKPVKIFDGQIARWESENVVIVLKEADDKHTGRLYFLSPECYRYVNNLL